MAKKNVAILIHEHPDREEIINKLCIDIPPIEIHEWLQTKYLNVQDAKFSLSTKTISDFKKDYLDFYTLIKDDLSKTKNNLDQNKDIQLEIQGNHQYHKALEKYIDSEVDIKVMLKKLVINVETRMSQIYDIVQEDSSNMKIDRVLIEYFNTITSILEKYSNILNGPLDQVNIQNNINIQVVDEHINVVYDIIKDILSKLDYDTYLTFIDMFNDRMKNIKSMENETLPVETRLTQAKILTEKISSKLEITE